MPVERAGFHAVERDGDKMETRDTISGLKSTKSDDATRDTTRLALRQARACERLPLSIRGLEIHSRRLKIIAAGRRDSATDLG